MHAGAIANVLNINAVPVQHYYLAEGTMLHLHRLIGWSVEWESVATQ
jgi:hypothetical protein